VHVYIELFGVIALSKVDLVDSKLILEPSSIYTSSEVNKLCGIVSENTGFDIRRVLPMKLATNEPDRSKVVECLVMNVLAGAVQQVCSSYLYHHRTIPLPRVEYQYSLLI
jgi:hypothetical protein